MTAREIIKGIMEHQNVTNAELAKRLSVSQATIWDRLNNKKGRKDIPVSLLREMVEVMNCEVIIREKDNGTEYTVTE